MLFIFSKFSIGVKLKFVTNSFGHTNSVAIKILNKLVVIN